MATSTGLPEHDTLSLDHPDPERLVNQLHVRPGEGGLEGMVDRVARRAFRAVREAPAGDALALYGALRGAIRAALREHIVAFDICGFSTLCRDATEIDPWEGRP